MQITDYSQHTDIVLLQLIAHGDQSAFTVLYQRHWKPLFREALNVLRSQREAEDCVQEVFVSLWKRRNTVVITGTLSAYLHTAVRYKCFDRIEHDLIRGGYLDDFIQYQTARQAQHSVEEELDARELAAGIAQVMDRMPEKMREVFRLSRQEQLTHKEIAGRLNISEETVKKQIYLALKLIRSHLGDTSLAMLITAVFF